MSAGVRVRFAPSPTGHLHIGGARTALFNYLFARQNSGVFVLRLEDTDAERSTEESVQMILADLKWLGLDWDEGPEKGGAYGPYRQLERQEYYRLQLAQLIETGHAYPCFCSSETLEAKRQQALELGAPVKYDGTCRRLSLSEAHARIGAGEAHVIRLKIPMGGKTVIEDLIRGNVSFDNRELDDFVLVRSNGLPTYNFAAVVDDAAMRISHVIRGDDHLSNTPRQICLYQALSQPLPQFAHVPMILGPDRTRLSKRHGATSVGAYAEAGYLPEALINYLALLGWSFDDKTTIFSRQELIEKFSLRKVSKNPAVFDPAKLQWMNGVYIRNQGEAEYLERALPVLVQSGLLPSSASETERAWAGRVAMAVKEQVKLLSDLPAQVRFFFGDEVEMETQAQDHLDQAQFKPELFQTLHRQISVLESFTSPGLEALLRDLVAQAGVKFGDLVHPLRAALTGRKHSPQILLVMELLGRERVLKRLAAGLKSVGITV
ncbi:MAG: glutamate--tRNA ligase [candidate division FCPU426 bacterium]